MIFASRISLPIDNTNKKYLSVFIQTTEENLVKVHFYHLIFLGLSATGKAQCDALENQLKKDEIFELVKKNLAG